MTTKEQLNSNPYDDKRAQEWAEWVTSPEAVTSRGQEINPLIRQWVVELHPKLVADIGCGQGICSEQIVDAEYIGIDPSRSLIQRAKQLYQAGSTKTFIEGDAYSIPLEENSVDAVLSVWVWSHLGNIALASKEMARVVKPGGGVLIINANPDTYEERKMFYKQYRMVDGVLVGDFDLGGGKVLSEGTLHFHTRDTMLAALDSAGIEVREVRTLGHKNNYPKGLYIAISGVKR